MYEHAHHGYIYYKYSETLLLAPSGNEEMPAVSDVEVIVQCIKCCMQAIFAYTYRSQDSVHNSCMSQRLRMQFPVKL